MKSFVRFLMALGLCAISYTVQAQGQILVHMEPGTSEDTVNAYLADMQAVEIGKSPLSAIRLWIVPDTIFKGNDTILAAESPRYAARRPKIKETCHNYQTFIPAPTPGTQEQPPFPCAMGYVVPPGDGCEVVIGLIDSGIDTSHAFFNGKEHYFWTNPDEIPGNGFDDDGNGYVDDIMGWDFVDSTANPADSNSHGTHICGTMIGMFDMASFPGPPPPIRIMNLRTQDSSGLGRLFDLILAIDYAATKGANILNLSLGYIDTAAINDTIPAPLAFALNEARNYANVLAVCAAGNEAVDIDTFRHYPGAFPLSHILTVSSSNCADKLSVFSNFGIVNADIGAPGEEVFSTVLGGMFESKNGSSMAAGIVSTTAALLATHLGGSGCKGDVSVFSPEEIKRAIIVSARVVPDFTDTVLTDGILNPMLALDSLLERLGNIEGQAWRDDGDGLQVGGESGITGIPVWLEDPEGRLLIEDSTDASGNYAFVQIPPSAYRLRFGGIADTLALSAPGPNSTPDPISALSDTILLLPSDSLIDLDAGYYPPLSVNVKLLLAGPFDGVSKMNTDLLRLQFLPFTEPFSSLTSDTLSFGIGANMPQYASDTLSDSAAVDWGMIEWRSGSDSTIIDMRLPVILLADGSVVLPSGFAPYLPGSSTVTQFLAFRFAGHLQTMTSTAVTPGGSLLDLRLPATGTHASDAQVSLTAGLMGIRMGDADSDGVVDAADRAATWNARNQTGYLPGDVNRDGVVDAADRAEAWNNRNRLSVLP